MSKQRKKYCISFVSPDGSIKECFFSAMSKKEANKNTSKFSKRLLHIKRKCKLIEILRS